MLKHLQKFFNGSVDLSQEEVEMTETEKATLAAAESKAAELPQLRPLLTKRQLIKSLPPNTK